MSNETFGFQRERTVSERLAGLHCVLGMGAMGHTRLYMCTQRLEVNSGYILLSSSNFS